MRCACVVHKVCIEQIPVNLCPCRNSVANRAAARSTGVRGRGGRRAAGGSSGSGTDRGGATRAADLSFGLGYAGLFGKDNGAGVMAGIYALGDGSDELGSDLEFRTRIGVSRAIRPPWRLGLAIEHKSNGGIGDINPGIQTILAVLSRRV